MKSRPGIGTLQNGGERSKKQFGFLLIGFNFFNFIFFYFSFSVFSLLFFINFRLRERERDNGKALEICEDNETIRVAIYRVAVTKDC